eukprot:5354313-Amphidinium_carterae.1
MESARKAKVGLQRSFLLGFMTCVCARSLAPQSRSLRSWVKASIITLLLAATSAIGIWLAVHVDEYEDHVTTKPQVEPQHAKHGIDFSHGAASMLINDLTSVLFRS